MDNLPACHVPDPNDRRADVVENATATTLRASKAALHRLWKDFVVTTTDKDPHSFSIICRQHYLATLATEMGGWIPAGGPAPAATAYSTTAQTKDQVTQAYKTFYRSHKMLPVRVRTKGQETPKDARERAAAQIPTAFMTTKYHKNPI